MLNTNKLVIDVIVVALASRSERPSRNYDWFALTDDLKRVNIDKVAASQLWCQVVCRTFKL